MSMLLGCSGKLRSEFGITSYDVHGTTIEDIFLDLVAQNELEGFEEHAEQGIPPAPASFGNLNLSDGRRRTPWGQATTIFHKRALIVRRSWLAPLLALAVAISGAWWPVRFVNGGVMSCGHQPFFDSAPSFWPPRLSENTLFAAPSSLVTMLNASVPEVFRDWRNASVDPFKAVADKDAFISAISSHYKNFSTSGGIYLDLSANEAIVAHRMSTYNLRLFNILSNAIYEHALNATSSRSGSRRIVTSFTTLPEMSTESLYTLQWLAIFGAAMAVFPAFFAIYIAKERHSSVQAMQVANGLANPLGLWLGHLMFDSLFTVFAATWITIVYGVIRDKFQGIGLLWLVMCLNGFVGTLLAYIVAILVKSPLGAFGVMVVSQFIIFLVRKSLEVLHRLTGSQLYLTGYIVTLFSVTPREVPRTMNILHFTLALVAPINSLVRAAFVSVNQFFLLCDGENITSGAGLISITRYGGPILRSAALYPVLLLVPCKPLHADVIVEAEHANSPSTDDPLRMLGVSKSYDGNKVVDDVSFTIPHNSLFVLLGPNGAGKTTTFDVIHGQQLPDMGDVLVNNTSVVFNTKNARVFFGVCPQSTAIDAHLTVREHLMIYGRLKGLNSGGELRRNVEELMAATELDQYANRLATKPSGGNQRKLALAIALIGNPPVVLVDEYSTGIDAKMKRELWAMLRHVTNNKAVFLTTHSMEEASYLATKVGIMSRRMLAVGTPHELESRTASYEVHFPCHTRDDFVKVQSAMTHIPGARMVDDIATRFEVPIGSVEDERSGVTSVASLFELLAKEQGFPEFTVGKSTLETAFIRIINDDMDSNSASEDRPKSKKIWGLC
ncbi:unnamed protein product [Cyclocybe aegerita]|uniref:ABC transporter domain-containing protein n=1 Tax=Cyclocybe aegerita TaxID=1973307 RepID=A0A8S0WLH8_CYCAE|nr:unnamed protein product [Cyclocybe aegerita]